MTAAVAFLAARFAGFFVQVPWSTVCKTLLTGTVLVPVLLLVVLLVKTGFGTAERRRARLHERLLAMEDQPTSSAKRYARGLSVAVEAMSSIVEAYDDEGDEPDATVADYITSEMLGDQRVPAQLSDLLSGLVNLNHLLLGRIEELSNTSKQDVLEWYAEAAEKLADGDFEPE